MSLEKEFSKYKKLYTEKSYEDNCDQELVTMSINLIMTLEMAEALAEASLLHNIPMDLLLAETIKSQNSELYPATVELIEEELPEDDSDFYPALPLEAYDATLLLEYYQ